MKMLSKNVTLVSVLLIAMLVSSVSAWTVLTAATGSGVRMDIEAAEATVVSSGWIELGDIGSGYDFSGTASGTITITNAKELVVTFSITDYVAEEWQAIDSGTLTITETGVAQLGTIYLTALSTVQVTLAEGTHTIRYDVAGVAGYPEGDQYVEFLVAVTVTTP